MKYQRTKSLISGMLWIIAGTSVTAAADDHLTDIRTLSKTEIEARRSVAMTENRKPTSLTRSIDHSARTPQDLAALQREGATLVDVISLRRELLGMPTLEEIDRNSPAAGFGVPRQHSRLGMSLDGTQIELVVIDEARDKKRGTTHITAVVAGDTAGIATFTVDDRSRQIVGTIRVGKQTYRVAPIDANSQALYLLSADATERRPRARATQGQLEFRHEQHELLTRIAPARVRLARNDLSVSLQGGDLGKVETPITAPSIARALGALGLLTNATGEEDLRILGSQNGANGSVRYSFEQLVNGVSVWRRNDITVGPGGEIQEIRASIVDSTWQPQEIAVSASQALSIATREIQRKVGSKAALTQAAEPVLRFYVDAQERHLVPRYSYHFASENEGVLTVNVDATSGAAEILASDSYAIGDDVLTSVHRRTTGAPTQPASGQTEYVRGEGPGGSDACPFAGNPNLQWKCYTPDVQSVYNTSRQLSVDWENVTAGSTILCCESMGVQSGSYRIQNIVLDTAAATADGAAYLPTTKTIVFNVPVTGIPGPQNTDTVVHEHMHAYLHAYNPFNYNTNALAAAVNEGLGDAMAAAYRLKHPVAGDDPWVFGDGTAPIASAYQRNLRDSTKDLAYLETTTDPAHTRGIAVGYFFYKLYCSNDPACATPQISADRLMKMVLQVADSMSDAEGDGFDLEDFQEAVFSAVNSSEPTVMNRVLTTWFSLVPPSAPIPAAPAIVDGSPLRCEGGFSLYSVYWSASANANAYGGYVLDPSGVSFTRTWVFSQDTLSGVGYTNYNTEARIDACNGSGCSGLSVDSFPMPAALCQ